MAKPSYKELEKRIQVLEENEKKYKEAEQKLSQLFQKQILFIQQTPLAVIDWNLEFKVSLWNKSAEKIFGFTEKEAVGKHISELIMPANLKEELNKIWFSLIDNKRANRSVNDNITKQGNIVTCDWYNTPLINEQGNVIGVVSLALDITEQKKAEREIKKLSAVVEQSANAIIITDAEGKIEYANPKLTELTEFTLDEILGKVPRILRSNTYAKEFHYELWKTIKSGKPWRGEYQNKTKTNKPFWEQSSITPIKDKKGNIINYLYVREDVTLKKKAEQALIESKNRYRTIVENISDGLIILDKNGVLLSTNSAFSKMFGYSFQEILKVKVASLIHEDNLDSYEDYLGLTNKNKVMTKDIIGCHKNGSRVFVTINSRVFKYNKKRAILVIISDISERKNMEQQIVKSIIKTEEKERARFAKELHDGLGPIFSTVKLYFQWLTETEDPNKRKFIIEKGNKNIKEAIRTLQEISNNLNPHVLVNFGLIEAIQIFIDQLSENKQIKFNYLTELNERFSEEIEITIYRVITELINNTLKYAKATEVIIKLAKNETTKHLNLYYSDNGKGFNIKKVEEKKQGLGLFNIKSRINTIGGKVSIKTKPNKGMVVEINIKLEN